MYYLFYFSKIVEGEVNDFFLEHLKSLNSKMVYVKSQQGNAVLSFKEIGPEFEKLRIKAAEKIRDFLIKLQTPISL